jgi:hypothetical protein
MSLMPSVIYAECRYAECHCVECRGAFDDAKAKLSGDLKA